ncbi:hypothetical protein F4808DRAFT_436189 [Astrocystis sublimbata]|nr:hypothetical protein F4808DRAFT_436189 [Astrocystis sublimbata]
MVLLLTLNAMPVEVIVEIFTELPTFHDVFALAQACHRLNAIWCGNATRIYHALTPTKFLKTARQLLADQCGTAIESTTLTAHDVRRMVRNAQQAEKVTFPFSLRTRPRHVKWILRNHGIMPKELHPSGLTQTEYPRFINGYYRACSLLTLGSSCWKERYKSYTLRQARRTLEVLRLGHPLGEEPWPSADERVFFYCGEVPQIRADLHNELMVHDERERDRLHGDIIYWMGRTRRDVSREFDERFEVYWEQQGGTKFSSIMDSHFHDFYDNIVGPCKPGNTPRPYDEYMRDVIWGDSSDEETYRLKYRPTSSGVTRKRSR